MKRDRFFYVKVAALLIVQVSLVYFAGETMQHVNSGKVREKEEVCVVIDAGHGGYQLRK